MFASDASGTYGSGLSVCRADPLLVKAVARQAGDADEAVYRLMGNPSGEAEVPRKGTEHRLPVRPDEFKSTAGEGPT